MQLTIASGHQLATADAIPLAELLAHPLAMFQPNILVRQFFNKHFGSLV
ncbi:hypothetical protein [Paenibacillus phytorum]|nr:hypothetical protein [Paenibacillus phytorum]